MAVGSSSIKLGWLVPGCCSLIDSILGYCGHPEHRSRSRCCVRASSVKKCAILIVLQLKHGEGLESMHLRSSVYRNAFLPGATKVCIGGVEALTEHLGAHWRI